MIDPRQLPLIDKRWRSGRSRFVVPPHVFNARDFHVDAIRTVEARAFVLEHHYSQSFVAARFCYGLFRVRELVGVAAFSIPMSQQVIPYYLGTAPSQGLELGRFVLLTEVGFNAESFFLAKCFARLRGADSNLKGIVSFADPLERRDPATDAILKRAHWGTAYRAAAATFVGRTSARWLHVLPNQQIVSARTLSKIRNDTQGRDYAAAMLVNAGAPDRRPHESGRAWLERIIPTFQRLHHPGNLAFTFTLSPSARRTGDS